MHKFDYDLKTENSEEEESKIRPTKLTRGKRVAFYEEDSESDASNSPVKQQSVRHLFQSFDTDVYFKVFPLPAY
jgi:hypothetical protein